MRLVCSLVVVSFAALIGPGLAALPASAQADPAAVLLRFVEARNAGDVEGAMALVAPDMSYVGGPACTPDQPCIGTDALRRDVQLFIADQVQTKLVDAPQVSGSTVTARFQSDNPDRRAIGVDRTLADYTVEVRDGRLRSWRSVPDLSDPQTAAWMAFQRSLAAQPGSAAGSPMLTLLRFQDARNQGDVERAMALVAPDMSYVGGPACTPDSPCVGTEAVRRDVELFIADQVQGIYVGTPEVVGTTVKARLETRNPDRAAIGVERTVGDVTAEVRDGKLVSWRNALDTSDPPTAAWLVYQRGQQASAAPAEADPNPGGD